MEPRVWELLFARLCHDLVSPVGAVNNGLELLAETLEDGDGGGEFAQDAVALASVSGRRAAVLLRFYRLAYGPPVRSGSGALAGVSALRALVGEFVEESKADVVWRDEDPLDPLPPGCEPGAYAKLLLNIVVLGEMALPRGGTIEIDRSNDGPQITVQGVGARLPDGVTDAMTPSADVSTLDPRAAHGFLTAWLARNLGLEPSVDSGPDRLLIGFAYRG